MVSKYLGSSATALILIEPDFYQYYSDSRQQGGTLSGPYMRTLFDDISKAIKSSLPNALISWDISPWANDMSAWWGYFQSSPYINFIHTSGGQSQGGSSTIKSGNPATWSGMRSLTGKNIIADSGLFIFIILIKEINFNNI